MAFGLLSLGGASSSSASTATVSNAVAVNPNIVFDSPNTTQEARNLPKFESTASTAAESRGGESRPSIGGLGLGGGEEGRSGVSPLLRLASNFIPRSSPSGGGVVGIDELALASETSAPSPEGQATFRVPTGLVIVGLGVVVVAVLLLKR